MFLCNKNRDKTKNKLLETSRKMWFPRYSDKAVLKTLMFFIFKEESFLGNMNGKAFL
jgi:hypothetical protein